LSLTTLENPQNRIWIYALCIQIEWAYLKNYQVHAVYNKATVMCYPTIVVFHEVRLIIIIIIIIFIRNYRIQKTKWTYVTFFCLFYMN